MEASLAKLELRDECVLPCLSMRSSFLLSHLLDLCVLQRTEEAEADLLFPSSPFFPVSFSLLLRFIAVLPLDVQREILLKAVEAPTYICPKDNGKM
jgi:hypothetical protein